METPRAGSKWLDQRTGNIAEIRETYRGMSGEFIFYSFHTWDETVHSDTLEEFFKNFKQV